MVCGLYTGADNIWMMMKHANFYRYVLTISQILSDTEYLGYVQQDHV